MRAALSALPSFSRRAAGPPRVPFRREDARRLNERFALLDRTERRAIMRAVNRGEAMTRKRDAELAVGVARRQQRFWSRAWVLGPSIAFVQVLVTPIGWTEGLLLAAWGTVLLGMMAAWWWTRARRAELRNLEVLGPRRPSAAAGGVGGDSGGTRGRVPRSRLPGGRPDGAARTGERSNTASGTEGSTTARPPRPRGRKRR
jgi:hypothetical protein